MGSDFNKPDSDTANRVNKAGISCSEVIGCSVIGTPVDYSDH